MEQRWKSQSRLVRKTNNHLGKVSGSWTASSGRGNDAPDAAESLKLKPPSEEEPSPSGQKTLSSSGASSFFANEHRATEVLQLQQWHELHIREGLLAALPRAGPTAGSLLDPANPLAGPHESVKLM